jgi:hypothetical protein
MKIALNCRAHEGPWGGGNRFVISMQEALAAAGHRAVATLDDDTDAVIIVDPRARNPLVTFTAGSVLRHVAWRNPRTVVVHRINECDERKGTTGMNRRLRIANYAADHTVFIAGWLRELDLWRRESPDSIIHNGADRHVFNAAGFTPWNGEEKLRLVTHHWGAHELKGFDVYRRLDEMMAGEPWRDRLEFTYVGNAPDAAREQLRHVRFVAPLDGTALAAELRSHHGYLTASRNEPGGMHHVEGAMCGLPLVYRRSGALPEYCGPYGVGFDGPTDVESALEEFRTRYRDLAAGMAGYPYDAARTTSRWLSLLDDLVGRRDEIAARRRLWRDPGAFILNQLPL